MLTLLENNQAKLFDCRNYSEIQTLEFPSDYGLPKEIKKSGHSAAGGGGGAAVKQSTATFNVENPYENT